MAYTFNVTRAMTIADLRNMIATGSPAEVLARLDALLELVVSRVEELSRDDVMALPATELGSLADGVLAALMKAAPGQQMTAAALKALAALKN
jgi:hypothetical protein